MRSSIQFSKYYKHLFRLVLKYSDMDPSGTEPFPDTLLFEQVESNNRQATEIYWNDQSSSNEFLLNQLLYNHFKLY